MVRSAAETGGIDAYGVGNLISSKKGTPPLNDLSRLSSARGWETVGRVIEALKSDKGSKPVVDTNT